MNRKFNAEIANCVRDLVKNVTKFQDDSAVLKHCQDYAIKKLEAADTMVFFNKREMDEQMISLSEKLVFHGFFIQADDLLKFYKQYIPDGARLSEGELTLRINAVKFITYLCERPTEYLLHNPFAYKRNLESEEEIIDWPAYLKEDIERWSPSHSESEWTDSDDSTSSCSSLNNLEQQQEEDNENPWKQRTRHLQQLNTKIKEEILTDYSNAKEFLQNTIQQQQISNHNSLLKIQEINSESQSQTGLLWEDFIEKKSMGLLPRNNTLNEYFVLREIIWQFFAPCTASVFKLKGNKLTPRDDITIPTLRQVTFESLLNSFVNYFELLHYFRAFYNSVWCERNSLIITIPNTYQNYACSILINVIQPLENELVLLERKLVSQENTMTLISLLNVELRNIFGCLKIVESVHKRCVLSSLEEEPLECATYLLTKLHICLMQASSKLEQDLILTLYLDSLAKYMSSIDLLLRNGPWYNDLNNEFVLERKFNNSRDEDNEDSTTNQAIMQLQFFQVKRELNQQAKKNPLIKIIITDLLEIAKNILLLSNMNKWTKNYNNNKNSNKSLYEELKKNFIQAIKQYFNSNSSKENEENVKREKEKQGEAEKNGQNKLNIDKSDGFLMASMSELIQNHNYNKEEEIEDENLKENENNKTLFEEISQITKSLFPAHEILVSTFSSTILSGEKEYGKLVKRALIEDYKLLEYLDLLQKLYLFKDDAIFAFYRRYFQLIEMQNGNWGNSIWLTSHLQDILMDFHPELCEKILIAIPQEWKEVKDPIKACEMLEIIFLIEDSEFPINLLIKNHQSNIQMKYKQVFTFILNIKYALYTLNHMSFSSLNVCKSRKKNKKKGFYKNIPKRLECLRFFLINQFASLQHFILGYVANKCKEDFDKRLSDFSSNFEDVIEAHEEYINTIFQACMEIRNFDLLSNGFTKLLYSVNELQNMWNDVKNVDEKKLAACEYCCKIASSNLQLIISPCVQNVESSDSEDE